VVRGVGGGGWGGGGGGGGKGGGVAGGVCRVWVGVGGGYSQSEEKVRGSQGPLILHYPVKSEKKEKELRN